MILNLRGPSGSGKSTVGHELIDMFPEHEEFYEPLLAGRKKLSSVPIAYRLPGELFVLGRYRARGGGCDGLMPPSSVLDIVRHYWAPGRHIFFESLIISSSRQPWFDYAAALSRGEFVFGFMDTPWELCVERVLQRNGGRPVKGDLVRLHQRSVMSVRRRALEHGLAVADIRHDGDPTAQVLRLFLGEGWTPPEAQQLDSRLQAARVVNAARQVAPNSTAVRRTQAELAGVSA